MCGHGYADKRLVLWARGGYGIIQTCPRGWYQQSRAVVTDAASFKKTFLSPFKQTNKQRRWQACCLWGQGGWLLSYSKTWDGNLFNECFNSSFIVLSDSLL